MQGTISNNRLVIHNDPTKLFAGKPNVVVPSAAPSESSSLIPTSRPGVSNATKQDVCEDKVMVSVSIDEVGKRLYFVSSIHLFYITLAAF